MPATASWAGIKQVYFNRKRRRLPEGHAAAAWERANNVEPYSRTDNARAFRVAFFA
jgi:hypothetical protein